MEKHPRVKLIALPYDSGHFKMRMGAGPETLIKNNIVTKLNSKGVTADWEVVQMEFDFPTEIATAFKLLKEIKYRVAECVVKNEFPIILSGNCNASVGVVAGLNSNQNKIGVVWFDAHGDCETPETTISGFLDGCSLSMLLGRCWNNLLRTLGGGDSVEGKSVILIGARDLSNYEIDFIKRNGIHYIKAAEIIENAHEHLMQAIKELKNRGVTNLHLHVDADVYDPSIAPANSYSVAGGLMPRDVNNAIDLLNQQVPIVSATIASYDPLLDEGNKMLVTLSDLILFIAGKKLLG